jgi:hypothetical protein
MDQNEVSDGGINLPAVPMKLVVKWCVVCDKPVAECSLGHPLGEQVWQDAQVLPPRGNLIPILATREQWDDIRSCIFQAKQEYATNAAEEASFDADVKLITDALRDHEDVYGDDDG